MTALPRHPLLCHPAGSCAALRGIEATACFTEQGALDLSFELQGDLSGIVWPDVQPSGAADGLWQHTCCEAFIAAVDHPAYCEFNFSPSGQWAAYAFRDYRQREMSFLAPIAPEIRCTRGAESFRLEATLPVELLPAGERLEISLTVVVEAADGSKTYWALKHAAVQPDFHLRQSFTLTLKVIPS